MWSKAKWSMGLVVLLAGVAAAQGNRPGPAGKPGVNKIGPAPELVARVRERVRMMRMWKLTELLQLDETTGAKLFPLLKSWDEKIEPLRKDMKEVRKQLKAAVEGALDDKSTTALVDKLVTTQQRMHELQAQRVAELRKILTPKQQARLIVVMPRVDRAIEKAVRQAIRGGRANVGGGKPDKADKKVDLQLDDDGDDDE